MSVDPWGLMTSSLVGEVAAARSAAAGAPGRVHRLSDEQPAGDDDAAMMDELVALLGPDAAGALVRCAHGATIDPIAQRQSLGLSIDERAALLLADRYGHGPLRVPLLRTWRTRCRDTEIIRRHEAGETQRELALNLRMTERQISRIVSNARNKMNPQTATTASALYALDNITSGFGIFRYGDRLPPEMPEDETAPLLANGIVSVTPPPEKPALLPLLREGDRDEGRKYKSNPTLADWLVLASEYRHAHGRPELTEEDAQAIAEQWQKMRDTDRRNAYQERCSMLIEHCRRMAALTPQPGVWLG